MWRAEVEAASVVAGVAAFDVVRLIVPEELWWSAKRQYQRAFSTARV